MKITQEKINQFLKGETSKEETAEIMLHMAVNPDLEEQFVIKQRLDYVDAQLEDYGSFIPVRSMAADDGKNLCDFQCESYILKTKGNKIEESALSEKARHNYWLRNEGTPIYNIGKLLESEELLVNRCTNATMANMVDALNDHMVIAVVNGDTLLGRTVDILDPDFSLENEPNHAVVVLNVDKENDKVKIYNPAEGDEATEYGLKVFENAWEESKNYMVTVREKKFPQEYNPQPIDVSNVTLDSDLEELVEFIAENAHDIWAIDKFKDGYSYAPLDANGKEQKGHNHYLVPYCMLDDEGKKPDRKMATGTIKLLKRLGYRLVNINSMYRCPDCGEILEPSNNFCPNCGRKLSWEDFR